MVIFFNFRRKTPHLNITHSLKSQYYFNEARHTPPEGDPLCPVHKKTHKPAIAKNIFGEWKYIVNTNLYNQAYTLTTCKHTVGYI